MRERNFVSWIFRTRVIFHRTWYLAFALIIIIVLTHFPEFYTFNQRLLLGVVASLLFFLGMAARQIGVSLIARYRHIPLTGIILYPFGGVPQLAREESLPILELLLAAVSLLSSLLTVVIFYSIYIALVVAGNELLGWLIQWLVDIYLLLFVAEFIPGFPLEGGRVLRAILWKYSCRHDLANRISIHLGQAFGALIFCGGAALLINRQWFTGLMVIFLGWTLFIAATGSLRHASIAKSLEGLTIEQIMSHDFSLIPRHVTLTDLAKDFILPKGQYQFVVFEDDQILGILSIDEIKSVPRKSWGKTTVGQVMKPASQYNTARTGQMAADLLDRMNVYDLKLMLVTDGNKVAGIADKDILLRFNKNRAMLKI
jgi:Zn-dependent protease